MLNFACFLAEGIGIAAVGGLLTEPWLNVSLWPGGGGAASLYSNITLLCMTVVAAGGYYRAAKSLIGSEFYHYAMQYLNYSNSGLHSILFLADRTAPNRTPGTVISSE
ncbi:hypothetical protein WJ0W_004389 [Paenibacillus melissococcoides]|uniref:Uncharacterized protein n=1 Tax=Paenibacillus melissococcoides TaxID=2912268 RepID=A0ABM9G620_9BACL|nr:hypothetical protein J6TS7_34330 [Paenibacillus dendritiformis]CAH8247154.1 hypothetical protein WJ0W_004389 [Paenibacillus melissococcoides]